MYEKHFGFKYKPFELVPNPDFLFLSQTHKKAITYLDYGIKEKIGFILLTGEIGSGKTTIVRNLLKNLSSTVILSRVNNTKTTSAELISMINEDFGLHVEGKSKTKLLSDLNEFLIEQYVKKNQPILLIDEAQNLSAELLEEIRLLSNLETDRAKLLHIILVGQPELKKTLMLPELIQLRQRININYHIVPLSVDETVMYIKHRLNIAGNLNAMELKDDMVIIINDFSRGIPRLINIICDFALLMACVEGKEQVTLDIIKTVALDLKSRDDNSNNFNNSSSEKTPENDDHAALSKIAGNLAMKLVQLERNIDNMTYKANSLKERLESFENDIPGALLSDLTLEIKELSARVAGIEKMPLSFNEAGSTSDPDNSS
jgi:putative secretion ATPase (PEP-CTERM system associated)